MIDINIPQRKNLKIEQAYPRLNDSHFYIENDNGSITVYYFKCVNDKPKALKYVLRGPEIDIWKNINGRLKSKDILNKLRKKFLLWANNGQSKDFYRLLRDWGSPALQLINMSKLPLGARPLLKQRESRLIKIGSDIIREVKTVEKTRREYRSYNYYKKRITKTRRHFEDVEKTLSHSLRDKTKVLGDNTYGGRFAESILGLGRFPKAARVLEVGGGLGWLGYNFTKKIREKLKDPGFRYFFLDLSLTLLKEQRRRNSLSSKTCAFTQSDACALPFKDNSFDIVIANECIADFPVVKLAKNDILGTVGQGRIIKSEGGASYSQAINKFKKYYRRSGDLMPDFIFPVGVICFLEELKRVLRPKGRALLVEYSSPISAPFLVELGGHFEYSPDFRVLESVAKNIGFEAKILGIDKFLKINSVPLLSLKSRKLLDKFLIKKPVKLNSELYTQADLRQELGPWAEKIQGLEFLSSKKEISGFQPGDFKVMLLEAKSG